MKLKRLIAILLSLVMTLGLLPTAAFAAGSAGQGETMRVFHLDCGRKYFSERQIKNLIDEMAQDGYNYLELAVGNDGLRFLLDDMSLKYSIGASAVEAEEEEPAVRLMEEEAPAEEMPAAAPEARAAGSTEHSFTSDAVKNAIKAGNNAYTAASSGELSETEMNNVISYAKSKGISIIPLVNTPGHMDAILHAAESLTGNNNLDYSGSVRTIDVTKAEAVAFTKALLQKYITYFADQGCTYFNMGADEYANDIFISGGMGFGNLASSGKYKDFINYINAVAGMIKTAGMTPIAFNDGIRYNRQEPVQINRDIIVSYWSSGWGGYNVAPAADLANAGFQILNTSGDWYYVLKTGASDINHVKEQISKTPWTSVMGSTVDRSKLVGAMVCLWCDEPGFTYSEENTKAQIKAFAEKNSDIFTIKPVVGDLPFTVGTTAGNLVESEPLTTAGLNITQDETKTLTYTGEGIIEADVVDNTDVFRIAVNDNNITVTALKGGAGILRVAVTAEGQMTRAAAGTTEYNIPITVTAKADFLEKDVTLAVGQTRTETIAGGNYNASTEDPNGKIIVTLSGQDAATTRVTSVTDGSSYYIKSEDGKYLNASGQFVDSVDNAAQWTWTSDKLQNGSHYLSRSGNGWTTTTQSSRATTLYYNEGTFYRTRSGLGFTWFPYTYSNPLGSPMSYTPAQTTVAITGFSQGSTTLTVGNVKYNVTVTPKPLENTTLKAEFWCTNARVIGAGVNADEMTISFTEVNKPVFAVNGVPKTGKSDGNTGRYYVYWKSVILPEGQHQTGVDGDDKTNSGTEIIAVMYDGTDYYYYSKVDPNTAVKIKPTDQLVSYYKQVFVRLQSDHAVIAGADWGAEQYYGWAPNSVQYTITEMDENGTQIGSKSSTMWYGTDGKIKDIGAPVDDGYEVYKATVKKGNSTTTYGEGESQPVPENLTLDRGSNYEVTYFIRPVKNLKVTYQWLGAPAGATLPKDNTTYAKNATVTVDTAYTDGKTLKVGTDEYTFHGWYKNNEYEGEPVTSFTITLPTTLYGYWAKTDAKKLEIKAASDTKVYDGTALTNNAYTVSYAGQELTKGTDGYYTANGIQFKLNDDVNVTGAQTDAGESDNTISGTKEIVYKDTGATAATFKNVAWVNGSLMVTKRDVTITSGSATKQYDGKALTKHEAEVTGDGFVDGQGADYSYTGSQTLVGSSENFFSYTLKEGTKADNYNITTGNGTLTVTDREAKYEITVEANGGSYTYDGTEKSVSGFKTTEFELDGNKYTVSGLTASAKGTDAGTYTAEVTGTAVVEDAAGNDVTGQFTVKTENGTLTIGKRSVTLTSANLSKGYDGKALINGDTALATESGWANGEGASYTFTGSQKAVGSSANAFSYTLNSNTKADNYNITKTEGTLTVTNRNGGSGGGGGTTYYILQYESNGGTSYKDERYASGTTVKLDKVPTREGYAFTGWYADEALTEKITNVRMNSARTVYAGWNASIVPDMLNGDDHFAYVIGCSDGLVRPTANISRAEVATIFFRLLKDDIRDENLTSYNIFDDVTEGMWCNKSISTMAKLGIVKGRSTNRFDPNANITRAEFAAICARFDTGLTNGDSNFTDISGHWAEAEIKRAASLGWIRGCTDGSFCPDTYITRAEAMTMINRVLCRILENEDDLLHGMNVWPDNQPGAWYYLAVQEATNSHDFKHKGEIYETWTQLTDDPDWTRYQN